mmetsp:Transcript_93408/g.250162  ORF Transcript_93408/g.250162 Transcript_93408/m.250162 type:complete len:614 (+) Transcript_93408:42-1883(+)
MGWRLTATLLVVGLARPPLAELPGESAALAALADMASLNELQSGELAMVIHRSWWQVATEVVRRSHIENVKVDRDVRAAVLSVKQKCEEVVKYLDPNFLNAKLVQPSLQWGQNDSAIFITAKLSQRWNAPGALELLDPNVTFDRNFFGFTGTGEHSKNRYRYELAIPLFDRIIPERSKFSPASVGRVTATLAKAWTGRLWPRLQDHPEKKASNWHRDMDMQEKFADKNDQAYQAMSSAASCKAEAKVFCLSKEACVRDCQDCGRTTDVFDGACVGPPAAGPTALSFTDTDVAADKVSGVVSITRPKKEYDVDGYVVYWGAGNDKLPDAPSVAKVGVPAGKDAAQAKIEWEGPPPVTASHLVAYAYNSQGESSTRASAEAHDRIRPTSPPAGVQFEDTNAERGIIGGTITIQRAADETRVSGYEVYFAKGSGSKLRRISANAFVASAGTGTGEGEVVVSVQNKTLPKGAKKLMVVSRYGEGSHREEMQVGPVVKIEDAHIPSGPGQIPAQVSATSDTDSRSKFVSTTVTIERAANATGITDYVGCWGQLMVPECEGDPIFTAPAQGNGNGSITVPVSGELPADSDGWRLLWVFSQNKWGRGEVGRSAHIQDFVG